MEERETKEKEANDRSKISPGGSRIVYHRHWGEKMAAQLSDRWCVDEEEKEEEECSCR